ncbi:MAG TPA: M23 family metallopeptidase [Flavobacteriales bacterium]|nr:peptidoglycan DD-metalloendopeptidase family protein [Flavobacteriales bacterium]HQW97640.1 M23 family metallopeptidase [Flavobacteriales bacterium]
MHSISIRGLILALFALTAIGVRSLAQDYVEALVTYGDQKLLEEEEAITDERLVVLLDSLCTLDPAPAELIRDLRLFQRIRTMDEEQMVALIDSLFDLDTVPYALVNEINLYVDQLPSQYDVDRSTMIAWDTDPHVKDSPIYGAWDCTSPNVYHALTFDGDTLVQLRLVDPAVDCGYHVPVPPILTSGFGWREGRNHNGVDLDLEVWDTVSTAFPGVVRFAATYGGYGRLVVVRHFNGLETFYAHLHRIKVTVGEEVDAGQLVGLGGSSGHSSGSHLHFEARYRGVPIDPGHMIDLQTGNLLCESLVLKRSRSSYLAYPKGTKFHTVTKGEHLTAIAAAYEVPLDAICYLNGLSQRSRLRVGQRLMVLPQDVAVQFAEIER